MAEESPGVSRRRLILFAKAPVPGQVKTRLCPPLSPEQAASLAGACLQDTVAAFSTIPDVAVEVAYTPDCAKGQFRRLLGGCRVPDLTAQAAGNLGDRLSAAFASACRGGRPVAVAGSDTPDLPPTFIESAFTALEDGRHDLVLGPAADGGYYLIAAGRFHPALFDAIPWSTAGVLETTLRRARELALRTCLLPEWEDVDTIAGLERLRRRLAAGPTRAPATWRVLATLPLGAASTGA